MGCPHKVCRFEKYAGDRTAAELLVHSEASLHAIVENASMTMYSLDRDFRYTHFNTHMRESLKKAYDIQIEIGDVIFDFLYKISAAEVEYWREVYSRALKGETLEFVKEFSVKAHTVFMKFYVNPIRVHDEVTGLSCVAIDITKERMAEIQVNKMAEDLLERNQNLEQYSYIIAHNLRSPIANLLGIANLLEMQEVSEVDKEEAKSHILNSARRLDDVIKDLSHILQTKEEVNLHRESVRFEEVVGNIMETINLVIEKSRAMILLDFSEQPGMITVKSFLYSIFYNLICNSIKYSKPGTPPVIKISSKQVNGKVCLKFEDNGLGMDLKTCGDKVFRLYKRFHPGVAEGKGMGLFMVKTHVETLGGTISIESAEGKGTIMTILL